MRLSPWVFISVFTVCLSPASVSSVRAPKLPSQALPVPFARQGTPYSCGAAALLGVLSYWQVYDDSESGLYAALETTEADGTEPQKIRDVAVHFGLQAEMKENLELKDLRQYLSLGSTVILSIQAWRGDANSEKPWKEIWDEGHYVVLVGLDTQYAYVMDPSIQTSYVYLPLTELLERWHDYEDRHGTLWRYQRLGIMIHGKNPLRSFPSTLSKME
jgi:uncharacterized protein